MKQRFGHYLEAWGIIAILQVLGVIAFLQGFIGMHTPAV